MSNNAFEKFSDITDLCYRPIIGNVIPDPDFKIGVTDAIFYLSAKCPLESDLSNRIFSGTHSTSIQCFRR